jgi:hypothetical protein
MKNVLKKIYLIILYIYQLLYIDKKNIKVISFFSINKNEIYKCDINGLWESSELDVADENLVKKVTMDKSLFPYKDEVISYSVCHLKKNKVSGGYLQAHFFDVKGYPSFYLFEGTPNERKEVALFFPGQSDTPIHDVWFGKRSIGSQYAYSLFEKGTSVFTPSLNGFGVTSIGGSPFRPNFFRRGSDKSNYLKTLLRTKKTLYELQLVQAMVVLDYLKKGRNLDINVVIGHSTGCATAASLIDVIPKGLLKKIDLFGGIFSLQDENRYMGLDGSPVIDLDKIYDKVVGYGAQFHVGNKDSVCMTFLDLFPRLDISFYNSAHDLPKSI